jgi:hypothetical protein
MAFTLARCQGRDRCQRCCLPAADEPPVPAMLPGDGAAFPLPPQSSPESQSNPAGKTERHFVRFVKSEIAAF